MSANSNHNKHKCVKLTDKTKTFRMDQKNNIQQYVKYNRNSSN